MADRPVGAYRGICFSHPGAMPLAIAAWAYGPQEFEHPASFWVPLLACPAVPHDALDIHCWTSQQWHPAFTDSFPLHSWARVARCTVAKRWSTRRVRGEQCELAEPSGDSPPHPRPFSHDHASHGARRREPLVESSADVNHNQTIRAQASRCMPTIEPQRKARGNTTRDHQGPTQHGQAISGVLRPTPTPQSSSLATDYWSSVGRSSDSRA
jgi:hypothetical protein